MDVILLCRKPCVSRRNQSRYTRLLFSGFAHAQSGFDREQEDWEDDSSSWDDLIDDESFDPEPMDDAALDDFDFDEIPDDSECVPDEVWDDDDEG